MGIEQFVRGLMLFCADLQKPDAVCQKTEPPSAVIQRFHSTRSKEKSWDGGLRVVATLRVNVLTGLYMSTFPRFLESVFALEG